MNKYGKRLKELREMRDLTQEELAKLLNTSRSRIGMYEQGKRQPDFEMQEAIADFFNVTIDYLFGRTPEEMLIESYQIGEKHRELMDLYDHAEPQVKAMVDYLLKYPQPDAELPSLHNDSNK